MRKATSLTICLLFLLIHAAASQAGSDLTYEPRGLIEMLSKGGLVVYFRHGVTETTGEKHVANEQLSDCSVQRNLSAAGIRQTKAIGKVIKQNKIIADKVLSSPYCRCMDTAKNLFGEAERSDFLYFAIHLDKKQRKQVSEKLKKLLSTMPLPGKNTIIVSHTANLKEAAEIWPAEEGEAHVFKPDGKGGYAHLGKIAPSDWFTF